MANITRDDLWKVFSIIVSILIVPLAGWVWNTNVVVAQLENDLGDAEQRVQVLEDNQVSTTHNSKQIIGIEKDIEYMKSTLGRIEAIVTRRD
tara:strand:- start:316 stop:591 length:276 start_codon:yes stop_codon:yes gene_type:complete